MGDFPDLGGLIELAGHRGADGVGLNPLHALFDDRPADCSPYSPNSRLFLNALYIDVERLPELQRSAFAESCDTNARLRASDIVDYVAVAELKCRGLRSAFDAFKAGPKTDRHAAFSKFRTERGAMLSRYACFEVLRHKFNKPWWEWPTEWQQPNDARCASLHAGPDSIGIEFVKFVQWAAHQQLQTCRDLAGSLGMKVGLYLDLAVGVESPGSGGWHEKVEVS